MMLNQCNQTYKGIQYEYNFLCKRCRMAEGIEAVAKHKITNREYMKRCCKAESIDIIASCKKINRENMKRHHMAESHEAAATQRSNDNTSKNRKRQGRQHNVNKAPPPRRWQKGRPRQKLIAGRRSQWWLRYDNGNWLTADYWLLSGWRVWEGWESNALSSLVRVSTLLLVQMINKWDISQSRWEISREGWEN